MRQLLPFEEWRLAFIDGELVVAHHQVCDSTSPPAQTPNPSDHQLFLGRVYFHSMEHGANAVAPRGELWSFPIKVWLCEYPVQLMSVAIGQSPRCVQIEMGLDFQQARPFFTYDTNMPVPVRIASGNGTAFHAGMMNRNTVDVDFHSTVGYGNIVASAKFKRLFDLGSMLDWMRWSIEIPVPWGTARDQRSNGHCCNEFLHFAPHVSKHSR